MEFPHLDDLDLDLDELDVKDMSSNVTEVKPSSSNLVNTKKKNVENDFDDSTKSGSTVMQTHSQHLKADNKEELADGGKDSVFADRNNSDQTKRESSSDENSCSYSKYEKEEPELKGPITTFSQYKEYVQEYRDKYESYLSLNKILEDYRDEFQKLGNELENAEKKGDMDRYNEVAEQIKESYRQCGARHKRLRKIFMVLHEELVNIKQRIKDFVQLQRD